MDGISVDSAPIIRAYIDLNLETLYNVRPFGVLPEQTLYSALRTVR